MKKIIFDLMVSQPELGSKFHGGGEYTKTVFRELCTKYGNDVEIIAFYDSNRFIDDWILKLIKDCNIKSYCIQSYDELSELDDFKTADTFVACLMKGVDRVNKPDTMKIIGVYHGFRALEKPIDYVAPLYEKNLYRMLRTSLKVLWPKRYYNRKYKQLLSKVGACNDIIGVSNHSGYSARVLFPNYDISRIHVFYSPEKYVDSFNNINVETENVVLMLGGDRWVKNVYRGILALDGLFSNNQMNGYTVKIVGGIPKMIKKKIKNLQKFVETDYLSALDLEKAYKSCDIFFYPTLNEGFGYPPQEAMKYGKTCVISAVSSLPEIYGDAAYYCNPYDIEEMQTRVLQAAERKIPKDIIDKACKRISEKQKKDLKELCQLIIQ